MQSSAPSSSPALDFARPEERLESLRDKLNVPGMVAGIASRNQIVWTKAFGYAGLTTRAPATPDTVFHLASLTKPFAAVVLLQLVGRGQLDLDAPVDHFGTAQHAEPDPKWIVEWSFKVGAMIPAEAEHRRRGR